MTVEDVIERLEDFACSDSVRVRDYEIAEIRRVARPNEDAFVEIILEND